ncbi:MAG: efflux RND transporter permease subunit [Tannerellaceae bacterium]|nr:efflux RND transporter permease subunit [Tannerellaceae bacterium]
MKMVNRIIEWAMRERQIVALLVIVLFAGGIYSLVVMPKQEMPGMIIRQGVVVGVFPGASAGEVEEQLTGPLERHLFTYAEVKRSKTTSKSEDGICYVRLELVDEVKDKNIVWSKIKHGLAQFKASLPTGVAALVADDNFGDVSSLLIAVESADKTPREIDSYCDAIEDRLRAVADVANVRRSGSQKEEIKVYADSEKLSAYGISMAMLRACLATQGATMAGGALEDGKLIMPVHIAGALDSERQVEEQVILLGADGDIVRVKDVGRVERRYPEPESYITHNGRRAALLSVEVNPGANIITFGKEVEEALDDFGSGLPESVHIELIANQPEVVAASIETFLKELLIAILAVVFVTMLLLPFRVAAVAATSIPVTVAVTLTVFFLAGLPLNMVTLVALIVVLGMIVDNSIVIVDSYIDKLDAGNDRWEAAVSSAGEYFKSILSATLAIGVTFFPLILTTKGAMSDMLQHFPWAISIALFISLAVAMLVIPPLQYFLIRKGLNKDVKDKKTALDYVQSAYERLLAIVFRYPRVTMAVAVTSVLSGGLIFQAIPQRMMPVAERDQFAVEIYLPEGSPLGKTAAVARSMEDILRADGRVKSVSAFIGTSSPRFHPVYAPQMPSKAYAQFIVNTVSDKATEAMLDEYSDRYACFFPEAYVRFKQLDFQAVEAAIDVRLTGDDIAGLKKEGEKIETFLRSLDECTFVRTSFDMPAPSVLIEPDIEESSRLGAGKAAIALAVSSALTPIKAGAIWEGSYALPLSIEVEDSPETAGALSDTRLTTQLGASIPLRQVAHISPQWNEGVITHRNGVRTLSILSDVRRFAYDNKVFGKVRAYVDSEIVPGLPDGIKLSYGGAVELEEEVMTPMITAMVIAFVIMFFILVFHFRRIKTALVIMLSTSLSVFGAAFGVWVLGIDFSSFAILGIIGLAGIIIRNGIIMFDYIELLRFKKGESIGEAAFNAGRRRMRPIFLTSAAASMGVLPMIISNNIMWAGMAAIIFFGTLISMILIVTVMPVAYCLLYKESKELKTK